MAESAVKNGKQATMSFKEWEEWGVRMRKAAEMARKAGGKVRVPVHMLSKGVKAVGVITFFYVAATDSVAVATEGAVKDALWPLPEIAAEAGSATDELYRAGKLNRQLQGRRFLELSEGGDKPYTPLSPIYVGPGGKK